MSLFSLLSGRMTDKQLAELRTQSRSPRPEVRSSSRNRMTPDLLEAAKSSSRRATETSDLVHKALGGSRSEAAKARKALESMHGRKLAEKLVSDKVKTLSSRERSAWIAKIFKR